MDTKQLPVGAPGKNIAEQLASQGVALDLPCAGNHYCGKCKVVVRGSAVSPVTEVEDFFLTPQERGEGVRLACVAQATGEIIIELPEERPALILSSTTANVGRVFDPMMAPGAHGVAIDIGTTTVVCALYCGADPEQLGSVSDLNWQRRFGADVISRIQYSIEHAVEPIHELIITQLESMVTQLCAEAEVPRETVTHAVITGNATMLHFLTGLDPRGIGSAPFTPMSLFGNWSDEILSGVHCYLPPAISSYAGSDLTCGILASEMVEKGSNACLVDIGTNGEMGMVYKGRLVSCSTAAGPAFEGMGISHGSPAKAGAISRVWFDEDRMMPDWETIGDAEPNGICGSGLIDAIALLVSEGAVKRNGRLLTTGHSLSPFIEEDDRGRRFVFPGTDIAITQDDIRTLQLSKGAIHAGVMTLLDDIGITVDDVGIFYLAGGFGSYLDLFSAETIGLAPDGAREKTVVLSNGALSGAAITLLDKHGVDRMDQIVAQCAYIELSGDERFMKNYVRSINFDV